MLFLLLLLFAEIAIAANDIAGPDSLPKQAQSLNNVQSGELLIKDEDNNSFYSSLLLSSDAHFNITGLMAHVSIKQNFKNDTDGYVEAIYVFPLPETAAVNRLVMQTGARRIEGKIKEKAQGEVGTASSVLLIIMRLTIRGTVGHIVPSNQSRIKVVS